MTIFKEDYAPVIQAVAAALGGENGKRLEEEYSQCSIVSLNETETIIRFLLPGRVVSGARGQASYGIEMTVNDADGQEIVVDLYRDFEGRLLELELIRFADGPVINPKWETLSRRVF